MAGDNDDNQAPVSVLFDDGSDQKRRDLRLKLKNVLEKADTLGEMIDSASLLSTDQKKGLLSNIATATAFANHQEEDILDFKDPISNAEEILTRADKSLDPERRDLRLKLETIFERAKTLKNTINSDPYLPQETKTALSQSISGIATGLASARADSQNEDILKFKESIFDAEKRLTSLETRVKNAIQKREIQEAKEELDFYSRNHHVTTQVKSIISQLDTDLGNQGKPLDQRLQSINASRTYQEIKKSNNETREKAVSTALAEIDAYITAREGKEKKSSDLRKNKLDTARRIKTELEKKETTAAQKIQAVDSILKEEGKIFSKRGNIFKHGAESFLVRVKGFLKDNSKESSLCSYFFAPPRAATLQKNLEGILAPVLNQPKI